MYSHCVLRNNTLSVFQNSHDVSPIISIQAKDIALIGEVITEEGPFAEDYAIVIVVASGDIYKIYGSEISRQIIDKLSIALNENISSLLLFSGHFDSRIIYPKELSGCSLFAIKKTTSGLLNRLRAILYGEEVELVLSEAALGCLASFARGGGVRVDL